MKPEETKQAVIKLLSEHHYDPDFLEEYGWNLNVIPSPDAAAYINSLCIYLLINNEYPEIKE